MTKGAQEAMLKDIYQHDVKITLAGRPAKVYTGHCTGLTFLDSPGYWIKIRVKQGKKKKLKKFLFHSSQIKIIEVLD